LKDLVYCAAGAGRKTFHREHSLDQGQWEICG
jgi:hypothetical protein